MDPTRLDVVVFGASGYTGKRVVKNLWKIAKHHQITWAIAGRSLEKLQQLLTDDEIVGVEDLSSSPTTPSIIIADVADEASLEAMAGQARLIINCTGPYKFYGAPVVRACLARNCHYIDVSAEPQFMEQMQLDYDKAAAAKAVYIVTACGHESVLIDMGLDLLQKNFQGTLNTFESHQDVKQDQTMMVPIMNTTSLETFVHILRDYGELKRIRSKLFKNPIPQLQPHLSIRKGPRKFPQYGGWSVPYPAADATVLRRSQRYFYEAKHKRPVQTATYMIVPNFFMMVILYFGAFLWKLLCKCKCGANLLLKYPHLMSGGSVGADPDIKDTQKMDFVIWLYGRGWKGKQCDVEYSSVEDGWILGKITGCDPYEVTGLCAAISALIIVKEPETLPAKGGVYTTAPFFTNTTIVEKLNHYGTVFQICDSGDLGG